MKKNGSFNKKQDNAGKISTYWLLIDIHANISSVSMPADMNEQTYLNPSYPFYTLPFSSAITNAFRFDETEIRDIPNSEKFELTRQGSGKSRHCP